MTIRSGVDVGVTMSASASTVYVTDTIDYTFDVTASGNRLADGATLEATLWSVTTESISAGTNSCTMTSTVGIRCQIADLAPGAHTTIVVHARGERAFDATQTAYVTIPGDGARH